MNATLKFQYWGGNKMGEVIYINFDSEIVKYKVDSGNEHSQALDLKRLRPFIGFIDKNGREIYEGDIVEFTIRGSKEDINGNPFRRWVNWHKTTYRWRRLLDCQCDPHSPLCIHAKAGSVPTLTDWANCEVVGNIYEHPHLIRTSEQGMMNKYKEETKEKRHL